MSKSIYFVTALYLIFFSTISLQAIDESKIPPALMEWKGWVLDNHKDNDCPTDYNNGSKLCDWNKKVSIALDGDKLSFEMEVMLFRDEENIVSLPYAYQSWVEGVSVDDKSAIVIGDNSTPVVMVSKGVHTIKGSIPYHKNLKYVQLPSDIALVELSKDGQSIYPPKIDTNGRLWLSDTESNSTQKGSFTASIYRKIIDAHPIKMQTYITMNVSGKMRRVVLDGIVLDGFLPTDVTSSLDATITEDKKLDIELKAGEWRIIIDSYNPQNISKLLKPKYSFVYDNQEVWAVQSDNNYRTIEIEGVSIDPSQTFLPEEDWKNLRAYLVSDGGITIKELYNSVKQQHKNELNLQREAWLDFDGGGYSFVDNITAQIDQPKRLEATDVLDLSSASINNNPSLITTLQNHPQKGIELRDEKLVIKASSRYEGDISMFLANGWSEKFDSVTTVLNLPPSWRLFASFGSDNKTSSWIDKWDLMDIFLVLLISIASYQLYGFRWAIPTTIFLVLLWHESDAPTVIWLGVFTSVAILRHIGDGKLRKFIQLIMIIFTSIALLQVVKLSVYEIRTALYPQLEINGDSYSYYENSDMFLSSSKPAPEPTYAPMMEEDKMVAEGMSKKVVMSSRAKTNYYQNQSIAPVPVILARKDLMLQNRIDPNAVVQTGIGVPKWSWNSHTFSWQSGVGSDERLELWLISPSITKLLKVINIFGMLFILVMIFREFINIQRVKGSPFFAKNAPKIALILSIFLLSPHNLKADIPSPQLLQELESKLTTPPSCLPNCASFESVNIDISNNNMQIDINISTAESVGVPIIGNRNIWLPKDVSVDGKEANLHLERGELWIWLEKGVHSIKLVGSIEGFEQIMFNPTLPLHNVKSVVDSDLWSVRSDNKSYIEIVNIDKTINKEKKKSKIEPMISVKRTFYFGQLWYIDTRITLLNDIDKPYTLNYPLLPNESILNRYTEIKDNKAIIHISNRQNEYQLRSSMPITKSLELKATDNYRVLESWQLDISSIWDMRYEGIEPIEQLKFDKTLIPSFKPWTNERLKLIFEKAKAVKGEILTIQSSHIDISQSQRYRDVNLNLNINSSKAQQYNISIEGATKLNPTIIDNQTHYLKINSDNSVVIPLKAKAQTIKLSWREEIASNNIYQFPKIDIGKDSTNSNITLNLPYDRWILWTSGPILGPAVLLWGVLLAILLFSIILGQIKSLPLKTQDWFLLGVGISTTSIMMLIPIIIWVFALRFKEIKGESITGKWSRGLMQTLLVLLTIATLITIVVSISQGLLGNPDMMIEGNSSYGNYLNWYSDRVYSNIPQPMVISVSIWYYKALILLWSIWIAFSLIKWLKWAWSVFTK